MLKTGKQQEKKISIMVRSGQVRAGQVGSGYVWM